MASVAGYLEHVLDFLVDDEQYEADIFSRGAASDAWKTVGERDHTSSHDTESSHYHWQAGILMLQYRGSEIIIQLCLVSPVYRA